MRLFKNKFFIVCLCIAVAFAAFTSTLSIMGYTSLTRNILGTLTAPIRYCVTAVADAIEGYSRYFTSIDTLIKENEALKEENAALDDQIKRAELLEAENRRLREYLNMRIEHPSFSLEEARIISREAGNYMTVLTLNRGTLHGVDVNMPVIVKEGIVGCVSEVGLNWCKVSTVLESTRAIGAYVERSGEVGQVNGEFQIRNDGYCSFSNGQADADVVVGDRILSVGVNSLYPADMVIGEVVAVGVNEYNRTVLATVEPAVDLSSLEWVMIVTGYEESGT